MGEVTVLALVPERGHSPRPQAHSRAEDSEVKLVMPRGLVMGGDTTRSPAHPCHPTPSLGKCNLTHVLPRKVERGGTGGAPSPPVH